MEKRRRNVERKRGEKGEKEQEGAWGGMIPRGPLNFLSFFSRFFMVLSLPGLHSCFMAGGFFLQSPDERAAL